MLSVILPAYNEEKMISVASRTINDIMEKENIPYEIIFIDDGSADGTWSSICTEVENNINVRGVQFSRNFGKEAAMFAGLENAWGEACVVLDCDLQHPPEKIVEMYRLWEQGYEVVEGVKEHRGEESALHKAASKTFYGLMSKAIGMNMADSSDFKLLDRKVVDTLNKMPERNVFFRALSYWVGFKKATITYRVRQRTEGESKWSTRSLIKYALTNITSFSTAPMQIVTFLGCFMMIAMVVLGIIAVSQKIMGMALDGFTTVILLQLLIGGLIMVSLGIMGIYIAKIYEECKGRPKYIVSKTCGRDKYDK